MGAFPCIILDSVKTSVSKVPQERSLVQGSLKALTNL